MTTQQQQQMGYDILRACDQYPMDRDHIFDLIDQGADLNVQNKEGYTVLMRFIQRWDNPLLIRALDAGADPYIRNNHNETALIVACHIGARWCLETLLEKAPHFDFDVQSTFGEKRTALHATLFCDLNASLQPDFLLTRILLKAGNPRMDIKDSCGRTAKDLLDDLHGRQFLKEISDIKTKQRNTRLDLINKTKARAHAKIDSVHKIKDSIKRKRLRLKRKP